MVVMGEEPGRLDHFSLFGLICQLFGYSHNTVVQRKPLLYDSIRFTVRYSKLYPVCSALLYTL